MVDHMNYIDQNTNSRNRGNKHIIVDWIFYLYMQSVLIIYTHYNTEK